MLSRLYALVYCHATTCSPKISPPRPIAATILGPPDYIQHCSLSPPDELRCLRWSPHQLYYRLNPTRSQIFEKAQGQPQSAPLCRPCFFYDLKLPLSVALLGVTSCVTDSYSRLRYSNRALNQYSNTTIMPLNCGSLANLSFTIIMCSCATIKPYISSTTFDQCIISFLVHHLHTKNLVLQIALACKQGAQIPTPHTGAFLCQILDQLL